MKKIVCILTICVGLLTSSCNDWLDVLPNNEQVTDNYWKSKEDVEAVITSGYFYMRMSVPVMLRWGELRGGTFYTTSKGTLDGDLEVQNFMVQPTNNVCGYKTIYKIINMANSVLHYAAGVRTVDDTYAESAMKSHLCEAYFMRAFSYFLLVRNFREVPLVLEAYVNDDAVFEVPKSTEAEIIEQIKKDIEAALLTGAAKTTYSEEWQTKGRATKWALYALMADVCLWNDDYDESIIYSNNILNATDAFRPAFIQNPSQWFEIFYPGNSNESIFELNYDYARYNETNNKEYQVKDPSKTVTSANSFNMFSDDISSHLSFTQTAVERLKSETDEVLANQTTMPDRIGRMLLGSYMYPNATISGTPVSFKDYQQQNLFYLWKYEGTDVVDVGNFREHYDANFILYRVAEIMLIKAEALIMKGGTENWATALELINQIHERAMLPPLDIAVEETDEQTLMQAVLHEREMEFIGEGKRWYDLLRLARKSDFSKYKEFVVSEIVEGNQTTNSAWIRSALVSNDAFYLPILQSEIDANPLLKQNPYYSSK